MLPGLGGGQRQEGAVVVGGGGRHLENRLFGSFVAFQIAGVAGQGELSSGQLDPVVGDVGGVGHPLLPEVDDLGAGAAVFAEQGHGVGVRQLLLPTARHPHDEGAGGDEQHQWSQCRPDQFAVAWGETQVHWSDQPQPWAGAR